MLSNLKVEIWNYKLQLLDLCKNLNMQFKKNSYMMYFP